MRREAGRGAGLILALVLAGCAGEAAPPPAGETASSEEIERLIRQLGDERIEARQAARQRLLALDEIAIPALAKARESADPEVATAAELLLYELHSVPLQIRRLGGKGVRKDLLGERWFTVNADGQRVGALYWRLDWNEAAESYSFCLQIGTSARVQGEMNRLFGARSYVLDYPGSGGKPVRIGMSPGGDPGHPVFHPHFLIWFIPFWELGVEPQEMEAVDFQDAKQHPMKVRVTRGAKEVVPSPSGARQGESVRVEGESMCWQIWWDEEKRLIRILGGRQGQEEYFPCTREEAILAVEKGKKGEWWK